MPYDWPALLYPDEWCFSILHHGSDCPSNNGLSSPFDLVTYWILVAAALVAFILQAQVPL
jgi:hypothetical protein